MIDLRDVNNLFIQKIIAWLFGKSSSEEVEGVEGGRGDVSPPVIWGASLGTCFLSQQKIENQIPNILRSK